MNGKHFIMACDERGTTRWPSSSKTWTLGGFVVDQIGRNQVISTWAGIKTMLCGSSDVELKWSHFFAGPHQKRQSNPLITKDYLERRRQAGLAVKELYEKTTALPVTVRVRKDKASPEAFRSSKNGRQILDIDTIWVGILGQFALYLEEHQGTGEVWFDQLGSRQEEAKKQSAWESIRNTPWPLGTEEQQKIQRISPRLQFFDSKTEALVQVADFLSGVIWAASEGDEYFMLRAIDKYVDRYGRSFRTLSVE